MILSACKVFNRACCAGVFAGTLLNPACDNRFSVCCVITQPSATVTRTATQQIFHRFLARITALFFFRLFLRLARKKSMLGDLLVIKYLTPTVGKYISAFCSHMEKSAALLTPHSAPESTRNASADFSEFKTVPLLTHVEPPEFICDSETLRCRSEMRQRGVVT